MIKKKILLTIRPCGPRVKKEKKILLSKTVPSSTGGHVLQCLRILKHLSLELDFLLGLLLMPEAFAWKQANDTQDNNNDHWNSPHKATLQCTSDGNSDHKGGQVTCNHFWNPPDILSSLVPPTSQVVLQILCNKNCACLCTAYVCCQSNDSPENGRISKLGGC